MRRLRTSLPASLIGIALLMAMSTASAENIGECSKAAVALQKGAYDDADAHYSLCIENGGLSPQNLLVAHFNRAIVRYNRGSLDGALGDFSKALDIQPALPDAYFYRARVFARKGESARALADFTSGLKLRPDAEAYFGRARLLQQQDRLDGAIADYTEAIKLDGSLAAAYNNRGNAYRSKHELRQAIADYDAAVQLQPDNAAFYANRAAVYDELNETAQARRDFEKAQELGASAPTAGATQSEYQPAKKKPAP